MLHNKISPNWMFFGRGKNFNLIFHLFVLAALTRVFFKSVRHQMRKMLCTSGKSIPTSMVNAYTRTIYNICTYSCMHVCARYHRSAESALWDENYTLNGTNILDRPVYYGEKGRNNSLACGLGAALWQGESSQIAVFLAVKWITCAQCTHRKNINVNLVVWHVNLTSAPISQ